MLIRDRKHPHGYHVERHPPQRATMMTHWTLIALAALGVCLFVLFQMYPNG